jgi:hypothetical protein
MISVEINTAIKDYFATLGAPYSNIPFLPLSAYDQTEAPFILYFEYQETFNDEQWFLKNSNLMYYIYDNNISRMKDIAHKLDLFLNVGDNVQGIVAQIEAPNEEYGQLRYRLRGSRKIAGSAFPPPEREGFASQMLNFRVVYLDQDIEP